ncbi:MAG: diguanylate cyclase [Actinomycetes bacterium]
MDNEDERADDAKLVVEPSGKIREADESAERLLGRPNLLGTPLLEHLHPTDRRIVASLLTTPQQHGARVVRLIDQGLGSQVAELRVSYDAGDPIKGSIIVSLRGLSTFVAPSRTAYTSAQLEKLFLASTDIITVLMPDGDWNASPAGTRILGHQPGYEPEGGLLSLVHPDDLERAVVALSEVAGGVRSQREAVRVRVRSADGDYMHFDCSGQDLTHDPDVGGIVIVARDVTGEQRAEDERADVEARYRATFERSPLGIAMIGLDGHVIEANDALCRMVGREQDGLVGKNVDGIVHPSDRILLSEHRANQQTGALMRASETIRLVHEDGHTVWALTDTSVIEHPDGSPAYHIALVADITDRKRLEARLEHQAFHDSLTGLPNRARLGDLLDSAWRDRTEDSYLAVLFVDLDHFKAVNDERDHDAGDELLGIVARRLRAVVRGGDGVCRYGGDEFVIVCQKVDSPHIAMELADRIRSSLSRPYLLTSGEVTIGASLGVAIASSQESPAELLRSADRAAGKAKEQGRNRVVAADIPL